jgi:hypothetical protein
MNNLRIIDLMPSNFDHVFSTMYLDWYHLCCAMYLHLKMRRFEDGKRLAVPMLGDLPMLSWVL